MKRKKLGAKLHDKRFNITADEITDVHMCNPCNDSILGSNLESKAIFESNCTDCDMCMIAENASSLSGNVDDTDDFAYFGFCVV